MTPALKRDPKAWSAILHGEARQRALRCIEEIAQVLSAQHSQPTSDLSVGEGSAGVALFFHTLHRNGVLPEHAGRDREILERVLGALDDATAEDASLHYGMPGIAWALQHIEAGHGEGEPDLDEVDGSFAARCERRLSDPAYPFDVSMGTAGLGLYALERIRHPMGIRLVRAAAAHLESVVNEAPGGRSWFNFPEFIPARIRPRSGSFGLGLAHGTAGVVAFLARAHATIGLSHSQRGLLNEAATWLTKVPRSAKPQERYPHVLLPDGRVNGSGRLAWCNGDLSVATAILAAGEALQSRPLIESSIETGLLAARRPPSEFGAAGPTICCGAAGSLHLFNCLYQRTGHESFADSARGWAYHLVERLAAFRSAPSQSDSEPAADRSEITFGRIKPGLLQGLSGIGLALLASVKDCEPEWDRLLCCRLPFPH
jgi:lantibiotic biosynthesis protein